MLKFLKDFLIYGLASVIGKIAALLLMPMYTKILTQEEYGIMAMLISVKGILDLASNLNIHSGIARDYYEKGINKTILVSTGFWSILTISISILIIMSLSCNFWVENVLGLHGHELDFILVLLSIPAGSFISYFSILTRFNKQPVKFAIGTIMSLIIQLTVNIYTIVVLHWGITGFFVGTLAGDLFSLIYFYLLNKSFVNLSFNWNYLKRALKYCIPLLPAILAGWVDSSLGQIFIGKSVSYTELGIYSVAVQFASAFTLISMALRNVWAPYLYESYQKPNFQSELDRLFTFFVLLAIFVSCALSLLSNELILIFSNKNYLDACIYLTMLCIPMSFLLLFPIAQSGLSISRNTKFVGIAYIIGSTLNILFLLAFLRKIGVVAVPIGLTISRIVTYFMMYSATRKYSSIHLPNQLLIALTLSVLISLVLAYFKSNIILRITFLIIITAFLTVIAIKKLNIINFLRSIINKADRSLL